MVITDGKTVQYGKTEKPKEKKPAAKTEATKKGGKK